MVAVLRILRLRDVEAVDCGGGAVVVMVVMVVMVVKLS